MLIDAHSHFQFPDYDADRAEVIARMKAAGVKTITVGTDFKTSRAAIALAEQYPDDLWASVGVHPTWEAGSWRLEAGTELLKLAKHPKVVAVGECGLDYYRLIHDSRFMIQESQKKLFIEHIRIAQEVKKPLMIHCRPSKGTDDAYEDLIEIISTLNPKLSTPNPIVHFFVGSPASAEKLLALGCYFTFGGVITFAREYDAAIKAIPLERILLETDAPYVAPAPYRGKRNEPAYVHEVVKQMAQLKSVPLEEVIRHTTENAQAVFNMSF